MSPDSPSYPADAGPSTFLLTVRGTPLPSTLEASRELHNATPEHHRASRAPARSAISATTSTSRSRTASTSLLIIDYWNSPTGLGMFFSNPQVQAEAGKLFSDRDGIVWAPAQGFGSWSLPVPFGRTPAGVGLLRVSVSAIEGAAAGFSADSGTVNEARNARSCLAQHLDARPRARREPGRRGDRRGHVERRREDGTTTTRSASASSTSGPCSRVSPPPRTWRAAPGDWIEW